MSNKLDNKNFNPETIAILEGHDPLLNDGMVNPPILQTSTVIFPTLESYFNAADKHLSHYKNGSDIKNSDYSYGLAGSQTSFSLRKLMAKLENADHCLLFPSGLNAIVSCLTAYLRPNDHLLIADTVYGPTRRFCNKFLSSIGVEVTYYDPLIGGEIKNLIKENTKVIFTESPGSITFEVQDIEAICHVANEINPDIVKMIDNSWATPFYYQPFDYGIDVSIHAGTKYIGGHADLLIGMVNVNDKCAKTIFDFHHHSGIGVSAQECYVAQRGIRTMKLRLDAHAQSALSLAKYLETHPKVTKILHPSFNSCPGHEIWQKTFTGAGGLFSFILDKHYDDNQLSNMMDNMNLFAIGCSWGGYNSLILPYDLSAVRSETKYQESGTLVRIYVGLENIDDLQNDLEMALARLG
ncbi:MAG: cystathionine beta-lyase [Pseudomonadota bacterium]